MRSIGKRNIKKLQLLVREEMSRGIPGAIERVESRIPPEWYEIWESAHDEINRVIDDERFKVARGE